ncbi:IQ and ubiquitin-like domain-containing protein [Ylistrum balloti]|uniref:IQ and ubiquitin-like domain-containing protein n=1 Tax=Ylistrum balloti TaxID=509963 RepID=UPI002905E6C2|nr:IQ and ubiquitin-like domain-containing protein [Ylistrum balloti]
MADQEAPPPTDNPEEGGAPAEPTQEQTPQEDAPTDAPPAETQSEEKPTEQTTEQTGETTTAPTETEAEKTEVTEEKKDEENPTTEGQEKEGESAEAPVEGEATQEAEQKEGEAAEAPSEGIVPAEGEAPAGEEVPSGETQQEATESAPEPTPAEEAAAPEQEPQSTQQEEAPAPTQQEVEAPAQQTTENFASQKDDPNSPRPEPEPASSKPVQDTTLRTTANLQATATVKFVLMPSGQVVTLACTLGQTLAQLKAHFAAELKMPINLIMLMFAGNNMEETKTLADLGVGPNGTIQLEMQSSDPVNTPIKSYRPRQEYHMPDVITVRVQTDDETSKDVVVEIERTTRKKPYLGGYRHKKTGVEFHHASAQTVRKQPAPSTLLKYCRDTQTVEQRHNLQQTKNDTSTQMTKIGVYVANLTDKLVKPGKYTTAEEHLDMMLCQVIIIQKYYRRWLAKRYVQKLKMDKQQRMEWERQEEIRKRREKEERIKREFERRMNPKTKEDFDLLYHALEKWRQEELERINHTMEDAERKAALCMLLDQETQLISAIGRHKLEADVENKEKRIQQFLKKAAAPKKWKGFDGKVTEMDTPYTIRAKELQDIYNSINMKYLTQDERLDVLLTLKHTVKEHDCKLTQEVIELIDREADLLMRGVKESNLDGLRKRISTLFLQYIKTPTFNPEAAKLLKVPQDPSSLRKNIYFCPSCNQYLPSTDFALSSNSRTVGKCRKCSKIDNDARTRQDISTYQYMLKVLRKAEEMYGDNSKIAFLLQEQDLRYLVEKIWNSQSILSAWEDLYDLVLVRWDKHQEWSPWNCILLTKDESSAHEKLVNLEEGYGSVFIHKVQQKHTLARNYFSRLPGMAEHIRIRANEKSMPSGPTIAGQQLPVQQRA